MLTAITDNTDQNTQERALAEAPSSGCYISPCQVIAWGQIAELALSNRVNTTAEDINNKTE